MPDTDFDIFFELLNEKYENINNVGGTAAAFRQFNLSRSRNNRKCVWEATSNWEVDILVYKSYFDNFRNVCRSYFIGHDTDAIISEMIASIQPDANNNIQWGETTRNITHDSRQFTIYVRRNGNDAYQGKIIFKSIEQNEQSLADCFDHFYRDLRRHLTEEFGRADIIIYDSLLFKR